MAKDPKVLFVIAGLLQVVWGLVPSASQFVIQEIPVEIYIALRWSISGFIFALFLGITKSWKPLATRDFLAVLLLGVLGYGLASFATLYGLQIGGVTNFALMSALGPAITSLMAIWMFRERPQGIFWLALPMSLSGLILLVVGKSQASSFSMAGWSVIFILGGAFLETLVFLSSKKYRSRMPISQYLAVAQLGTAAVMWLLQFSVFHQTSSLAELSVRGFVAALFVSIVACVLCYGILYWLLARMDGHRLALFDGIHALSATAFGIFFFGEKLSGVMFIGGTLILSGLTLGNLPKNATPEISGRSRPGRAKLPVDVTKTT